MSMVQKEELEFIESLITHVVEKRDLLLDDEDITELANAIIIGQKNK